VTARGRVSSNGQEARCQLAPRLLSGTRSRTRDGGVATFYFGLALDERAYGLLCLLRASPEPGAATGKNSDGGETTPADRRIFAALRRGCLIFNPLSPPLLRRIRPRRRLYRRPHPAPLHGRHRHNRSAIMADSPPTPLQKRFKYLTMTDCPRPSTCPYLLKKRSSSSIRSSTKRSSSHR